MLNPGYLLDVITVALQIIKLSPNGIVSVNPNTWYFLNYYLSKLFDKGMTF